MNVLSALRRAFTLLVATLAGAVHAADTAAWQVFQHEHVLGTSLELKFVARDADRAAAAESAALAEIDRLAKLLSGYDATSEFSRWQATRGVAVPVSAELFAVLALFDTWRERTHGALDASAAVAGQLWKTPPTPVARRPRWNWTPPSPRSAKRTGASIPSRARPRMCPTRRSC